MAPLWLVLAALLAITNLLGIQLVRHWESTVEMWSDRTDKLVSAIHEAYGLVIRAESRVPLALLNKEELPTEVFLQDIPRLENELLPQLQLTKSPLELEGGDTEQFLDEVRRRIERLRDLSSLEGSGDTPAIIARLQEGEAIRLEGSLRDLSQRLIQHRVALRNQIDGQFARELWQVIALIVVSSAILVLLLIASARRVRRELRLRERAEALARESERLEHSRATEFQTLVDTVPAVVLISHDRESQVVTGSREAYATLRLPVGANTSKTAILAPPQHFTVFQGGKEIPLRELPIQYAARTGEAVRDTELELVFDDGQVRHLFGSVEPLFDDHGNPRGSIACFTDITERKEADLLLKASEARWKLSLETGQLGFFEYDYEQGKTRWNDSEFRLIGLEPGSVSPAADVFLTMVHPDDQLRLEGEWKDALEHGRLDSEFRIVLPNGEVRWLVGKGTVIEDAAGRKRWFTGVNIDITRAKRIEEDLSRAVRERTEVLNTLNAFMATAPIGMAVIDPDSRCRFVNPLLAEIFGDSVESQIGKTFEERVPGLAPVLRRRFNEVMETGVVMRELELEGETSAHSGEQRTLLESWFPIHGGDNGISAVGVVVQDVTERKRAEIELARHRDRLQEIVDQKTRELAASLQRLNTSERLAALGTLAAGLGHDLANLVLPIRARLESLSLSPATPEMRGDIVAIGQALDHLNNLSAGMRLMALDPNRPRAASEATDLTVWWNEAQGVFRGVLPRSVRLEGKITPGLGVALPRHQLLQAIFNLVQNAGEVLDGESDAWVRIEILPDPNAGDSFVLIKVSDNGPGMSDEVKARCFDPYFSTKGRAISTGMGLSLVRGIVDSVKGTITVESTLQVGTTFIVRLPRRSPIDRLLPRSHGATRSAAISISEPRQAALATMIAERLDVKVESPGDRATPTSGVWITDVATRGAVENFLSQSKEHRVIYLGSRSFDPGSLEERREYQGRMVALPARPRPTVLRDTIARLIEGSAEAAA